VTIEAGESGSAANLLGSLLFRRTVGAPRGGRGTNGGAVERRTPVMTQMGFGKNVPVTVEVHFRETLPFGKTNSPPYPLCLCLCMGLFCLRTMTLAYGCLLLQDLDTMYGKVFAAMYEGSMLGSGPEVFALWPYIISNADREGYLELNFDLVAAKIGMKPGEVERVVKRFMEPDAKSRSKKQGGRKLEKCGEFLYHVINYEYYRAIRNAEDRKESNRLSQARYREKKKAGILDKGTKHEQENIKKWADGEQPEPMP
jgi:hypothetical protein